MKKSNTKSKSNLTPSEHLTKYVQEIIDFEDYPRKYRPGNSSIEAQLLCVEEHCRMAKLPDNSYFRPSITQLEDWIRGLPSCFSVECYNTMIELRLKKWGFITENESIDHVDKKVSQWWRQIAIELYRQITQSYKYMNTYRYEVQGRNGYHAIDLYKGDICQRYFNAFNTRKLANSVCAELNCALQLGAE